MIFFILGFFSLIAQTLLFREAFQVYEGSELGIGIFFGSWMLWVAMGAWFSRFLPLPAFLKNVPQCLPLLYIPAYFLESYGITHARDLSGVLAYEIYPYGEMLFSSLLVLAPVSFVTGLLFALSCRIFQDQGPHIISRVYILESLGAFSGGIWVTLALYFGVADSTLLFSSLPLLAAAIIQRFYRRKPILLGGVVILLTLPLLFRFDLDLDQKRKELLWQQYLQGSTPEGGFRTSGGLYLYGHVEDQFIVLDRSGTVETFPSASPAAELIGTVLSQHPKARDFLVIGNQSLGLSHALLTLPQTGRISLLHPDPEFYPTLSKTLKDRSHDPVLRALGRVEILAEDSRRVLASRKSNFDLILLNLPDPDTAVLNRFFSQEFFKILRASLRTGGVLAVRVSGGENYLGEELAYLGASTQATLRSVYKNTVFRAGEDSWFLASDSDDLSESPALLRDRILTIREIKSIFDPQLLMSLYLPDRIQFQKMKYQEVLNREGESRLVSTDRQPFSHLFALLHHSKQSLGLYSKLMKVLSPIGSRLFWVALILLGLIRLWFLAKNRRGNVGLSSFDCFLILFTGGAAGISYQCILMFVFQTWHGSLFLFVGLISSIFMLGLTLGSYVLKKIILLGLSQNRALLVWVGGHLGFCLLAVYRAGNGNPSVLVLCFILAGFLTGAAFPLGESILSRLGSSVKTSSSNLESWDHLGGALGGVLTGMVLLPLLGVANTLGLLAGGMFLHSLVLIPYLREKRRFPLRLQTDRRLRLTSYVLVYLGLLALSGALLFNLEKDRRVGARFLQTARMLSSGLEIDVRGYPGEQSQGEFYTLLKSGEKKREVQAYVLDSQGLNPRIKSYGGALELSLRIDVQGRLEDLVIVDSHDTPSYLRRVEKWMKGFIGREVFSAKAFEKMDGVSGATITAEAVRHGVARVGTRFANQVLGHENQGSKDRGPSLPEASSLVLILATILALVLRQFPHKNLRIAYLLGVTVLLGVVFNLQFSTQQIFSLVFLRLPEFGWNHAFLLVVGMPFLVLCFGNIYCGYLCPFGALQELIGNLRSGDDSLDPGKETWKLGCGVKYFLLFLLVMVYSLSGESSLFNADPLVTFFSEEMSLRVLCFSFLILMVSFVYRRFFCRNLCPAGAFFSLLNRVRLIKPAIPAVKIGKCDLGVLKKKDLDCICCDRCR